MYDPSIGRWLQEDPEGFEAEDPNLYRYVGNGPNNWTDPSGLWRWLNSVGNFLYDVADLAVEPVRMGADLLRAGSFGVQTALGGSPAEPQWNSRLARSIPREQERSAEQVLGDVYSGIANEALEPVRITADLLRAGSFGVQTAFGGSPAEPGWNSRLARQVPPIHDPFATLNYIMQAERDHLRNSAVAVLYYGAGRCFGGNGTPSSGPAGNVGPVSGLPRTGSAANPPITRRGFHPDGSPRRISDPHHAFPDVVDNFARDATQFTIPIRGPGGIIIGQARLYQVQGSLSGEVGIFEWIVENGAVTHRRFIPRGRITGFPNQVP